MSPLRVEREYRPDLARAAKALVILLTTKDAVTGAVSVEEVCTGDSAGPAVTVAAGQRKAPSSQEGAEVEVHERRTRKEPATVNHYSHVVPSMSETPSPRALGAEAHPGLGARPAPRVELDGTPGAGRG